MLKIHVAHGFRHLGEGQRTNPAPEAISRIGEGNIKPVDLYYLIFGDYNDLEVLDLLKNQILLTDKG